MGGLRYFVRRFVGLFPALAMILIATFSVVHFAPGDPAGVLAGEYADTATIADVRRQLGLDQSLMTQMGNYAASLAAGDLGNSFYFGRPVTEIIAERLPATLLLTATALALSIVIGIALGRASARRPGSAFDSGVMTATLVGYAIPGFWLGQIAVIIVGLRLDLLPVLGMTDTRIVYTGWAYVADVAKHLILPAGVLAVSEITLVTRLTSKGLQRQMKLDYARSAKARGVAAESVIGRHAFPNAALPLVTVIGARVGFLFSGAVVVETVFSWPGIGLLLRDAANAGDRPLVLGLVLLVSISVLFANLATDLLYAQIDPRIRLR